MRSFHLSLVLALRLRLQLPLAIATQEAGQCLAAGASGHANSGCVTIPEYPACEYSCNDQKYISPNSGNRKQIWSPCPDGPEGCRNCEDRNPRCPEFASAYDGYGCEDNPSFMIDQCPKSCNTCHVQDVRVRCTELVAMEDALKPGDLNATFQRILSISGLQTEVLSRDPWIVRFPNFLSEEEVAHLRHRKETWQRASDTGAVGADGRHTKLFSSHRSTGVVWCNAECHNHLISTRIRSRISELVRVHPRYFESFQFLQYEKGEYYKSHHDASISHDIAKHRIYTFFIYLNDVAAGGATHFPSLGLRVQPSAGSAILWPSVLNHDPNQLEIRTNHEAEVVEEGVKYSMNIWIHLGPYTSAHLLGCSGSPID